MHPLNDHPKPATYPIKLFESSKLRQFASYEDYVKRAPVFTAQNKYNANKVDKYFANYNKTGFISSIDYLIRPGISADEKLSDYVDFDLSSKLEINGTYPNNLLLEVMNGDCPHGFYIAGSRFEELDLNSPCDAILFSFTGLTSMFGLIFPMAWGVARDDWSFNAKIPAILGAITLVFDLLKCGFYDYPEYTNSNYFEEVKVCLANETAQNGCKSTVDTSAHYQLISLLTLQKNYYGELIKRPNFSKDYYQTLTPLKVEKYEGGINKYFKDDSKPGLIIGGKEKYIEVVHGTCPDNYINNNSSFTLAHEETSYSCNYEKYEWAKLAPWSGLLATFFWVKGFYYSLLTTSVYMTSLGILHYKSTKCKESENTGQEPIQIKYFEEVKYCIPEADSNVLAQAIEHNEL